MPSDGRARASPPKNRITRQQIWNGATTTGWDNNSNLRSELPHEDSMLLAAGASHCRVCRRRVKMLRIPTTIANPIRLAARVAAPLMLAAGGRLLSDVISRRHSSVGSVQQSGTMDRRAEEDPGAEYVALLVSAVGRVCGLSVG